jgi:hypothetical protein
MYCCPIKDYLTDSDGILKVSIMAGCVIINPVRSSSIHYKTVKVAYDLNHWLRKKKKSSFYKYYYAWIDTWRMMK